MRGTAARSIAAPGYQVLLDQAREWQELSVKLTDSANECPKLLKEWGPQLPPMEARCTRLTNAIAKILARDRRAQRFLDGRSVASLYRLKWGAAYWGFEAYLLRKQEHLMEDAAHRLRDERDAELLRANECETLIAEFASAFQP